MPVLAPILFTTDVELALAKMIESLRDTPCAHWLKKPEPKASPAPVRSTTFTSSYMPALMMVLPSEATTPLGPSLMMTTGTRLQAWRMSSSIVSPSTNCCISSLLRDKTSMSSSSGRSLSTLANSPLPGLHITLIPACLAWRRSLSISSILPARLERYSQSASLCVKSKSLKW